MNLQEHGTAHNMAHARITKSYLFSDDPAQLLPPTDDDELVHTSCNALPAIPSNIGPLLVMTWQSIAVENPQLIPVVGIRRDPAQSRARYVTCQARALR